MDPAAQFGDGIPTLGPVLYSASQIAGRVAEIAEAIRRDHGSKPIRLVAALKGAWIFTADIARAIDSEVDVDFLAAASYGGRIASAGQVCITAADGLDLSGSRVVLVEDIVDTGLTAKVLLEHLEGRGAESIRLASLLSKPVRRTVDVQIDYLGFECPDEFVVGYGMDCMGAYRGLPDVHSLAKPPKAS